MTGWGRDVLQREVANRLAGLQASIRPSSVNELADAACTLSDVIFWSNVSLCEFEVFNGLIIAFEKDDFFLDGHTQWKHMLLTSVACNNLCRAFRWRDSDRVTIVGKPATIQSVWSVYEYLKRELVRLTDVELRTTEADEILSPSREERRTMFYATAIETIDDKLLHSIRDKIAADEGIEHHGRLSEISHMKAKRRFFPNVHYPQPPIQRLNPGLIDEMGRRVMPKWDWDYRLHEVDETSLPRDEEVEVH